MTPQQSGQRPATFVTIRERHEMRDMARAKHGLLTIAAAFDRGPATVWRHCQDVLSIRDEKRARLAAIAAAYAAAPRDEKHLLAERFGFSSRTSLQMSVSRYRKRVRAAAERQKLSVPNLTPSPVGAGQA